MFAAAAIVGIGNAKVSTTIELLSPTVLSGTRDKAHITDTVKRFLRRHEPFENEGIVQDKNKCIEERFALVRTTDSLLNPKQLDAALYNKPLRKALLKRWIAASVDARLRAVSKLATDWRYRKYARLFTS